MALAVQVERMAAELAELKSVVENHISTVAVKNDQFGIRAARLRKMAGGSAMEQLKERVVRLEDFVGYGMEAWLRWHMGSLSPSAKPNAGGIGKSVGKWSCMSSLGGMGQGWLTTSVPVLGPKGNLLEHDFGPGKTSVGNSKVSGQMITKQRMYAKVVGRGSCWDTPSSAASKARPMS